jgi:hypothetical protein
VDGQPITDGRQGHLTYMRWRGREKKGRKRARGPSERNARLGVPLCPFDAQRCSHDIAVIYSLLLQSPADDGLTPNRDVRDLHECAAMNHRRPPSARSQSRGVMPARAASR